MDLLLDTHSLIWFLKGDKYISKTARDVIEDADNNKIVSIASIWEIAIKLSLKKIRFNIGFKKFLEIVEENGFEILPISFEHALIVSTLEFIHRDPFDRLLIAQCKFDNLSIVTKDKNIKTQCSYRLVKTTNGYHRLYVDLLTAIPEKHTFNYAGALL